MRKLLNMLLVTLLSVATIATVSTGTINQAHAIGTGECGAYSGSSSLPVNATTVTYGGKKWDIIGWNNGTASNGVSGPNNSVTLLLNRDSYQGFTESRVYFNESTSTNTYKNSDLQTAMNNDAEELSTIEGIIARTLTGGSETGVSYTNYNPDNIAGDTVEDQKLWPLSIAEVSQLKVSERYFPGNWWLRTPGHYGNYAAIVGGDSSVYPDGFSVYNNYAVRPALYLNLSSPIFSSTSFTTAFKIGACPTIPKVTDSNGYTWDIVGLNDSGTSKGMTTETGKATLLLSQTSINKFENENYSGKIYDKFNSPTTTNTNIYKDSTLSKIMSGIYTQLQNDSNYQIVERTLTGGSNNYGAGSGYNDDYIAGDTVLNQGVWALSVKEAEQLNLRERVFSDHWWLRTPGNYDNCVAGIYSSGGVVPHGPVVTFNNAIRPALYLNLSSPIFQSNIDSGKLSANWKSEMVDSNVEIPFAELSTISVTGISMTPTAATLTVGSAKQLSATVSPSNATNKSVTWASSNSKVATVSSGGKVTAKAVGTVTIIVKSKASSSKTAKSVITVKAKVKNPKKFKINSITVGKKKSKALTVKWTKQGSKKLTKVQLRYRVKGTSKWKTIAISPNAKSKKVKKLKVGKMYQFQIRGYKTISGKKYYSSWSGTKTSGKVR
jgi:uncharacterized protein YjdB